MTDYTQGIRKTVVTRVVIKHLKRDDPFFPNWDFEGRETPDETWQIWITIKSGLLPETSACCTLPSEAEANAYAERHAVGTEWPISVKWKGYERQRLNYIRGGIDTQMVPGAGNAGDGESPLAFNILDDAGIYAGNYSSLPSQRVLDFLGRQRVGDLKCRFGENWQIAAAFEYCWTKLHPSSPAYVAAAYQFQYYIKQDDFAAGYLWRDLENLVHGVEAEALKSIERAKKAGVAGSEKSADTRKKRRAALLTAMEAIAIRNPDFTKLGPDSVAKLAVNECTETAPSLWSQGKGQVGEYLGEIRRGEAGEDMQARYVALFPPKPPRRSRS